jgi:hypothetical protein
MDRARILEIVRLEFHEHRFDFFAEPVPSSNRPVTVPACPLCRVRLQTVPQFVDHLCEKVQAAVEREFYDPSKTVNRAVPSSGRLAQNPACLRSAQG